MKKIIAIIALLVFVSSCSTMNNNGANINKTTNNGNTVQETMDNNTEVVDLSPDEEKIVEDLLK